MPDQISQKPVRVIELILVTGVAFAATIFVSIYSLFSGSLIPTAQGGHVLVFYGLIYELIALAVLWYVLFRQGRSARDIGLAFSWKDIPVSLLLWGVAYGAFYICYLIIYFGHYYVVGRLYSQPTNVRTYLDGGASAGTLIFVLVNPIYEELIARAYTISEVKFLTRSSIVAVVISTVLQTLYHLYQGIPAAIALGASFLVLSVYFVKYGRIVPVILAHLYFDLLALLVYAAW